MRPSIAVGSATARVALAEPPRMVGNGDGTFQVKVDYPTGAAPKSVAVADVSGDGKPDLVVANQVASTVSVLGRDHAGRRAGGVRAEVVAIALGELPERLQFLATSKVMDTALVIDGQALPSTTSSSACPRLAGRLGRHLEYDLRSPRTR